MNIQVYGRNAPRKLSPCYGPDTQAGSAGWSIITPAHPRKLRVFGATLACDGLGNGWNGEVSGDKPAFLHVTIGEHFNSDKTAMGETFIDESFDGSTDEFTAVVFASPFSIPLGVGVEPFDVNEVFVTVWASNGLDGGPDPSISYADIRVYVDLGFAPEAS